MTSPPVTPDQDRAGHTPSGVSFSPTAVVAHPAIVLRRKLDVRRKLMVVTHAFIVVKMRRTRERRKTSSSQNTKGGLSDCIMAQFMIAVLVPA